MNRFTQYTQDATCVCFDRGYVIDRQGDFAACSCEAGAEWTAARAAKVAPVTAEAPDLAPAIAAPAAKVVELKRTRSSAKVAGLSYEIRPTKAGHVVTFRYGGAFETWPLVKGNAWMSDCSDRAPMPRAISEHCARVAGQLASLIEAKRAA